MQMQQQLAEAQRQFQDEAVLIAKGDEECSRLVKAEEEHSNVVAAQQAKINQLSLADKFLQATDPRFLAFIASETTQSDPLQL